MRNPIVQFKEEVGTGDTKAAALKRKKFANIFIPLFLGACVVALVLVVMYEEPTRANLVTDDSAQGQAMTESMQVAAIAGVVEDLDAVRGEAEESVRDKSKADTAAVKKKSPFAVGDIVVAAGECVGFAEESDLATFRSMLQHGDVPKARKYYEQLHHTRMGGKLSPGDEMSVLRIAWNGAVLVETGTYRWWVAPDWLKFPSVENGSAEE